MKHVEKLSSLELAEGVKIVMFSTPTCGVCKMLEPTINNLLKNTEIESFKIDATVDIESAEVFDIKSVPLTFIYKDGEVVESFVGFKSQGMIENLINTHTK